MAYSRFSDSVFYTFRSSHCENTQASQTFVCHTQTTSTSITYCELKQLVSRQRFVDQILMDLEAPCASCSEELNRHIDTFILEIEREYRSEDDMFEEAFNDKKAPPRRFDAVIFATVFVAAIGMGIAAFLTQESKYLLVDTLDKLKSIFK